MTKGILTQKYLKECVHYNPKTGVFTWKERPREHFKNDSTAKGWNTRRSGTKAGNLHEYWQIRINYMYYYHHRLAFLYMTGKWPKDQVDHINHDRADNRWINLREATGQENHKNEIFRKTNTSGFTGVSHCKRYNKWTTRIMVNGKYKNLGYFDDKQDAIKARKTANIKYGFHENHGKKQVI